MSNNVQLPTYQNILGHMIDHAPKLADLFEETVSESSINVIPETNRFLRQQLCKLTEVDTRALRYSLDDNAPSSVWWGEFDSLLARDLLG